MTNVWRSGQCNRASCNTRGFPFKAERLGLTSSLGPVITPQPVIMLALSFPPWWQQKLQLPNIWTENMGLGQPYRKMGKRGQSPCATVWALLQCHQLSLLRFACSPSALIWHASLCFSHRLSFLLSHLSKVKRWRALPLQLRSINTINNKDPVVTATNVKWIPLFL